MEKRSPGLYVPCPASIRPPTASRTHRGPEAVCRLSRAAILSLPTALRSSSTGPASSLLFRRFPPYRPEITAARSNNLHFKRLWTLKSLRAFSSRCGFLIFGKPFPFCQETF